MDLEYKYDRVGPDHKLRSDFRNFLLLPIQVKPGGALDRLRNEDVPAKEVREELMELVAKSYSIDFVYTFTTEDIKKFLVYSEYIIKAEKSLAELKKAVKSAYEAGINYDIFQNHLVDEYGELEKKGRPFTNFWERRY